MACPGSVALCDTVPEQSPSSYALEGTQAHEVLEAIVRVQLSGNDGAVIAENEGVLKAAPKDMNDAVDVAFDYIGDLVEQTPFVIVERQMELPSEIAPGEVGGTVDYAFYFKDEGLVEVIDYKHGAGVPVEVKGNKQARIYALEIIWANFWRFDRVKLTIIQPRAFHPDGPIRSEVLSVAEMLDFHADVEQAILAAQRPDAPLVVGEEQCRWCPAKLICPAREKLALELTQNDFAGVTTVAPGSMSPEKIGDILSKKDMVIDWLKAVEEEGYRLAMSGTEIPGQKLVDAIGRRSWAGDINTVSASLAAIVPTFTPDDFMERSLIGVVEAEKKIKAGAKAAGVSINEATQKFAFLTTKKSSGKLQLVSNDDKRPAVNPAKTAFEGATMLPQITGDLQ